jgi:hypothetical protein
MLNAEKSPKPKISKNFYFLHHGHLNGAMIGYRSDIVQPC